LLTTAMSDESSLVKRKPIAFRESIILVSAAASLNCESSINQCDSVTECGVRAEFVTGSCRALEGEKRNLRGYLKIHAMIA
jgi:hypothetical protein